ncbi:MAG: endolytic transglycosylase MltG [bacterium]|nr:endolytic transglycosylase MltG [bacterium]
MYKFVTMSFTVMGISFALFLFLLKAPTSEVSYRGLEIPHGTGFGEVAEALDESGFIRSSFVFKIYGALSGSAHRIQPGNYSISAASSTPDIINLLAEGGRQAITIRIPEGATIADIDMLLSAASVLPKNALKNFSSKSLSNTYEFLSGIDSLEGFLFPDTYKFFPYTETVVIVKKFLDNFEQKVWKELHFAQNGYSLKNKLTLASLLEKEVPEIWDRRVVAGILEKRIRSGVPLQVDATVIFAKCLGAFMMCENPRMLRSDTVIESRYNTYIYKGLPPTPIGNPGLTAIKAALTPATSEYWYYLSDPKTKRTIFSATLDEHNDNRARYLGI